MRVEHTIFLRKVEELCSASPECKNFNITFKQFTETWRPHMHRKGKDKELREQEALARNEDGQVFGLLARVKTNRGKASCIVPPEEVVHFQKVFHNILLVAGLGKKKKRQ